MKIVLDFDDPEILPLKPWLMVIRLARIQHELNRSQNKTAAAHRLGISRYSVYRAPLAGARH